MRKKGQVVTNGLNGQLAQHGINQELLEKYPLTIRSITPVRGVWRLDTNRGPYCLKKTTLDLTKLKFILRAMDYLSKKGFSRLALPLPTIDGHYFVTTGEGQYYLTPWLRGREADFRVGWHGVLAAETLAGLHLASRGYVPEIKNLRDYVGTWPQRWLNALKELEIFRDVARQKIVKTGFDKGFLAVVDYYLAQGKSALELLRIAGYHETVKKNRQQMTLCHRDYTYHNLLINRYRQVYVLDFDYCAFDHKEGDLARFIRKVMEKNHWKWEKALPLLLEYEKTIPLQKEERLLVLAALTFPQTFWRLAGKYYHEPQSQKEEKLRLSLAQMEEDRNLRGEFLERLRWEWLE
ncbi:MAG: CotS family spore coat protein [Clostridia bacterium]|nr:CotS family spore coat protein [Clostridia bacterium]